MLKSHLHSHTQCSTEIHNSQEIEEKPKVFKNWWMDKVMVHVQDKVLFSHESHSAIPDNRAGTRDQYVK